MRSVTLWFLSYRRVRPLRAITFNPLRLSAYIYVSKLTIIGSDNGLSPGRRQVIIWTNAGILVIRSVGTNFIEILSDVHTFSFKKKHLKISSAKCWPFSLQWRHNERGSVSNHRRLGGLLSRLFRHRSRKTSKLRVTGLCEGNPAVDSPHKGPVTRKMFHLMTSSFVQGEMS